MPLSEHEQRLLEEMERNLYHNDADFVAAIGNRGGRRNYRTIVIGLLVALAGVAGIVSGVAVRQPLIGVVGFVVMFVGVLLSLSRPRREAGDSVPDSSPAASRPGFMDRLNERWDRRQDEADH